MISTHHMLHFIVIFNTLVEPIYVNPYDYEKNLPIIFSNDLFGC